MNATLAFLEQPAVVLITGAIIRAGTNGDATKQAARAKEVAAIAAALGQISAGNIAAGAAALQAALVTSALDPSEALALQEVISFLAQMQSTVAAVLTKTVVGQVANTIVQNVVSAVQATCALYPAPAPVAAAPVSAPAPAAAAQAK